VSQENVTKLDLGCGKHPADGFIGVDAVAFPGVSVVADLRAPWPWADSSIDEVHSSHFLEHLEQSERIHFFNELHRVLKPGAQARIITPHWSHERSLGDPTHRWPAVCSWTYFYLNATWRKVNAPHCDFEDSGYGYTCDFDYVLAGTHDPNDTYVAFRTMEVKMSLMAHSVNVTTDLIATLTKKVPA